MRLKPAFQVMPPCLSTPEEIVRHLRKYFTDLEVESFAPDEEREFSFLTEMDERPLRIVVQVNPELNRLVLLTMFLGDTKRTETALNELAAALNRRLHFVAAIVPTDDGCPFALESWLMLDNGACLTGQVERFADLHREATAQVGPWIVRMLAGQINTTKVIGAVSTEAGPNTGDNDDGQA